MTTLLRRWLRPTASLRHWHVTVYTRANCCCCHTAIGLLERYARRYRFIVEPVDVDADPALAERYGASVPVVAINGKVRFRGVVNPVLLDRLIAADRERRAS
jgi:glutaredoxin